METEKSEEKVTVVSEIKVEDIADYIRLSEPNESDKKFLNTALTVAKQFILNTTGIENEEKLDEYPDLIIVVYVLCEDMYDNRALYVDKTNMNRVVETILGFHDFNLL